MNLDAAAFGELIERRYVTDFWLGSDKYQASKAYMVSTPDDYPEDARAGFKDTTIYSNWNLVLPTSQQQRLVKWYSAEHNEDASSGRLDVVVLLKPIEQFAPPAALFEQTFENDTFRVWVRRTLSDARTARRAR